MCQLVKTIIQIDAHAVRPFIACYFCACMSYAIGRVDTGHWP